MAFVVDASVTMAWCFADEATAYTRAVLHRLRTADALAPAIWPLEVTNVLLVGERRQRISASDATAFLQRLQPLPIGVDDAGVSAAWGLTVALARQHGLSAYDAAYLELAMRQAIPLATCDSRLQQAAQAAGISLVQFGDEVMGVHHGDAESARRADGGGGRWRGKQGTADRRERWHSWPLGLGSSEAVRFR